MSTSSGVATAMSTTHAPVTASSIVNAFWKAASWSSSSCATYLSPMPACLTNSSVDSETAMTPHTP